MSNLTKYLPYLDTLDISVEEKIQLLEALWQMMSEQADKAFGVHSVQLGVEGSKVNQVQEAFGCATSLEMSPPDAANDNNNNQAEEKTHAV